MAARAAAPGDTIAGVLLAGLGGYIISQALKWEIVGIDGPGPGFFPLGYGIAILVLSLALAIGSFLRAAPPASEKSAPADRGGLWAALLAWACFTAAVALMPVLGFATSFAALTFVLVALIFRKPLLTAAITAVFAALGFHLVFPFALGIALPTGRLGF